MKKDMQDESALMNSRDRHLGVSISSEYYQPVPMFFTREGAQLNLIGHYRGKSAFLICNGPSFVKLDHSLLNKPGVMTFGINNGPKTFRPNFWTCVDDPHRFLKSIWLDPRITKFIPQQHFEKPIFDNEKWEMMKLRVGECPNVIGYRRNEKFMADRFLWEDTFNWGNHKDYGGGRSVMLPSLRILFLLGFRKVYLLGCDMKMAQNYTYHFDEQRSKGAVNCNNSTYDRLKNDYLPELKPIFEAEGFNVFNCNENSELKVFPFKPFDAAIREATEALGDIANERCWGMYANPSEKPRWKQEPPTDRKMHLQTINALANGETPPALIKKLPPEYQFDMDRVNEDGAGVDVPPHMPPQMTPPQVIHPRLNKAVTVTPYRNITIPAPIEASIDECRGTGEVKVAQETAANSVAQSEVKYRTPLITLIENDPANPKPVSKPSLQPTNIVRPQLFPKPMPPQENNPVKWNSFNKVVLDHRNGCIDIPATNAERARRGLPVPWTPEIGEKEVKEPPIQ